MFRFNRILDTEVLLHNGKVMLANLTVRHYLPSPQACKAKYEGMHGLDPGLVVNNVPGLFWTSNSTVSRVKRSHVVNMPKIRMLYFSTFLVQNFTS